MKHKKILAAVLILIAVTAWFSSGRGQPATAAEPVPPKTVAVAKVTRADLDRTVDITAELHPYQQVSIFAKVPGYLKTITVDVGDHVTAGQVIATLEVPEQTADLARAQATYNVQKLEYDRVQAIIKQKPGLLAQDEVDKAHADYDVAKANLEHAKALADYATITVPFDGVITKRFADPGAMIQAGISSSTQVLPIVNIADEGRLRLILPVPESIVPQIAVGQAVDVSIPVLKRKIAATVSRKSDSINDATRTMEVEVDLDNTDLSLTPGMYATANLLLERHKDALSLPLQAIGGKDKPNVWLVNSQGQIEERPVTTGIQTPDRMEILDGLQDGDQVVFGTRGSVAVGMKVTPQLMANQGEGQK